MKSTSVTNNINNGSVLFKCSIISHDSVTVSQHAQHRDPETEAATWNSAIINVIIYTRYSCADMSQCLLRKKASVNIMLNKLECPSIYFDQLFLYF